MPKVDKRGRSDRVTMRSQGQQSRSRERIETLLEVAEGLLAEVGLDGLKMRELARRAELPIASVYHYFPSSSAIARALAIRHMEQVETFLTSRQQMLLHDEASPDQRARLAGRFAVDFADFLLQSPATPAIWDSLRATPELRALDFKDTVKNAELLRPLLRWAIPHLREDEEADISLILVETVRSNLVLIMHSPKKSWQAKIRALERVMTAAVRGMQRHENPS